MPPKQKHPGRVRQGRRTAAAGMDVDAPAEGTADDADGEQSSDITGAKLAAQSDQDTEAIELLETMAEDGGPIAASTSASGPSVENTEDGNAAADGSDPGDGSEKEDSPKKKTRPTRLPKQPSPLDFDSLRGNRSNIYEDRGYGFQLTVWDWTDLDQHIVYRRVSDLHMTGDALALEYIDSRTMCVEWLSQIFNNLETEGHAKGCGYVIKADKESNQELYDQLEACNYQLYDPEMLPYHLRFPNKLHPLAKILFALTADPSKYRPREQVEKLKYHNIQGLNIMKILVSLFLLTCHPCLTPLLSADGADGQAVHECAFMPHPNSES